MKKSNPIQKNIIKIEGIGSRDFNKSITTIGEITNKSKIYHKVISAKFECPSCGNTLSVLQVTAKFKEPSRCTCGRRGKFRVVEREYSDFIDFDITSLDKDGIMNILKCTVNLGKIDPKLRNIIQIGDKIKTTGVLKPILKDKINVEKELIINNIEKIKNKEKNPINRAKELLDNISDRDFEFVVGEIWKNKGYEVEVTKKTGDMGMDVLAVKGNERIAIQCKHNKKGTPVGNEIVQKAIGSAHSPYNANKVVVLTSSYFSPSAEKVAKESKIPVELINKNKLIEEIIKYYYKIKDFITKNSSLVITDKLDKTKEMFALELRNTVKRLQRKRGKNTLSFDIILEDLRWSCLNCKLESFEEFKTIFKEVCSIDNVQLNVDFDKYKEAIENIIADNKQFDIDRISTDISTAQRNKIIVIRDIIDKFDKKGKKTIPIKEIMVEASKSNIDKIKFKEIIEKLKREGFIFEPKREIIQKI